MSREVRELIQEINELEEMKNRMPDGKIKDSIQKNIDGLTQQLDQLVLAKHQK